MILRVGACYLPGPEYIKESQCVISPAKELSEATWIWFMKKLLKGIPLPNSREFYKLVRQHNDKYTEHFIAQRAKEDAAKNIPAADSNEPAPFEKQIMHETAKLASKISARYKTCLEMLDAKIKAEEAFVNQQRNHTQENVESVSSVEENAVDTAHILQDAHRQLELAEKRYNEFYERLGRGPIVYIPHWLYWIFAFAIFAGEIPLNALVFEIFGENQIMTWVMAFIIGLSVPLSAHFIGIKFREHVEGIHWGNIAKGSIASALIVAALYGLSHMRQVYLDANKEALGLSDTLVESSFEFFWLNVAVLAAAIMIAYLSHDASPAFQRAEQDLKAARKRVEKLERRRIGMLKSSRFRKSRLINDVNRDFRDGLNKINLLKGHYDMLLKEGQELEDQCLQGFRHDVEIYRQENLRARTDGKRPNSFSTELGFELKLAGIAEKLPN